jgi:hypothetical protein
MQLWETMMMMMMWTSKGLGAVLEYKRSSHSVYAITS